MWKGRVYVGTLDGRLVALDAKTGKEAWSVVTVDQTKKYTITGAPRIVKGKVLIGNGGAEFGVRGYISAYDADDGKLAWRFYTVPGDPVAAVRGARSCKKAAATWKGEYWKLGGGGTVWDSMAYDPELDLLYIGVGNGSPWNQRLRSPGGGDNLFLSSIVALKPDTGEYVWHYQTTPGRIVGLHGDAAHRSRRPRDRRPAAQGADAGAEERLLLRPRSRPDGKLISAQPFTTHQLGERRRHEDAAGRSTNPAARYGDTHKPWFAMPGPLGSHNWQPMSFSPQTHLVYIPAQDIPFAYGDPKTFAPNPIAFNTGIDPSILGMPRRSERQGAGARVRARVPQGVGPRRRRKRCGASSSRAPWNGGVLSTAGGLVFEGNAAGTFNAYSADKGAALWSFPAQTGVIAAPMSYAVGGQQYVAVVVGWGGSYPLVVRRDGAQGVARAEPQPRAGVSPRRHGAAAGASADARAGQAARAPRAMRRRCSRRASSSITAYCGVCHGDSAVGAGVVPDLRWSPMLATAERGGASCSRDRARRTAW